ncbi:hypothetical protein L2Y94_19155 [Luteibacter aegosomatis]|uniref:hypothetical protein n=1 Tax=Luteibacter aegosomatis TaxID=2911537 RepID=UPI001FFBB50E|nr:hypothetical protein [Luteibacter aegosomatis]UPG85397.1 hypothetical protein L2Y94_19155 [Luteibacter aegosomatis]
MIIPSLHPLHRCLITGLCIVAPSMAMAAKPGPDVLSLYKEHQEARLDDTPTRGIDPASLLVRPDSPYSDIAHQPDFTNTSAWGAVLGDLPSSIGYDDAVDIVRWDLGTTRARPEVDVPVSRTVRLANGRRLDPFIEASLVKANVDADIFTRIIDITGYRHSTKAAGYAVAMQILRNQMKAFPRERWGELGIEGEVHERVMSGTSLRHLTSYDLHYLSLLLQHRLIHRPFGAATATGQRELPAAYRVARVAAAYRDMEGYLSYPCNPDATPREGRAGRGEGDDRPLCFVAATDRAVYRWYLREADEQTHPIPSEPEQSGLARMLAAAALFMPLLDVAAIAEVAEVAAADEVAAGEATAEAASAEEGIDEAVERVSPLTCPLEA